MAHVHQWVNRYPTPLESGQVISDAKPGEQIAKCISEIQGVIDGLTGADGEGKAAITEDDTRGILPDPSGSTDEMVVKVQSGKLVIGWVTATG